MSIRTESHKEKAKRTKAVETLERLLKPGDRVYTTLLHVSRSRMLRSIKVVVPYTRQETVPGKHPEYTIGKLDLDIWDISGLVARVIGARFDDQRGGVYVSGAGMDMGFWIVHQLGRALYPKGFKTWEGYWRNEPMDFDQDGGYAFRHVWL